MFLTGSKIKELSLVSGAQDGQFQPAGIDLTAAKVSEFSSCGAVDFDNSKRKLPEVAELPFPQDGSPLHLAPGAYKVQFSELVKIPPGCVAMALPRSSLLRMGVSTHNALWDPGYEGRSEGLIYVANPHGVDIYKGAKVVQLVFVRLEEAASSLYTGQYHGENK